MVKKKLISIPTRKKDRKAWKLSRKIARRNKKEMA